MNVTRYSWQRYWHPRGDNGRVRFDPAGFLLDPEDGFWTSRETGLSTLPELERFNCLALIGEPGIGKSTALAEERDRLKSSGKHPAYRDLRSISDAAGLREFLGELNMRPNIFGTPTLLLDSLDECRLEVSNAAEMIGEALESMGPPRPRLLICCRSADWPQSFESRLTALYGTDNTAVYVMAPLRRRDVETALDAEHIDHDAFFDEINRLRLTPIATKPLTLQMLLAEFGTGRDLGASQAAVVERGCLRLCEESPARSDTPGHYGHLTPQQRIDIAKRIAATTLLTDREYLSTGPNHDPKPGAVPIGELVDPSAPLSEILETLNTGLFVARGPALHGWYHKLLQEFLAARFLADQNLPPDQLRSLLFKGERVVPQLREAASWLAQMRTEFFRSVLATDPEALVASDAELASDEARRLTTDSLLCSSTTGRYGRLDWAVADGLSKLSHPGLHHQLEAVLSKKGTNGIALETALLIALKNRVAGAAKPAADIALDRVHPAPIRRHAAMVVAAAGCKTEKLRLSPLASHEETDDELKATALAALWPDQMDTEQLFAALTPPRETVIGGTYDRFLRQLPAQLRENDLPQALAWITNSRFNGESHPPFGEMAREIMGQALRRNPSPATLQTLATAAMASAQQGNDLRPTFEKSNTQERLGLLQACIAKLRGAPNRELYSARAAGLTPSDVPEGLRLALRTQDPATKAAIGDALLQVPNGADPNRDALAEAAAIDPILKEHFKPFLGPILLNSQTADYLRCEAKFRTDQIQRDAEKDREATKRTDQAITELQAAVAGNVDAWWRFTVFVSADRDGRLADHETNLKQLPGWRSIAHANPDQIPVAAKNYLENAPDEYRAHQLGLDRRAIAGIRALRFLAESDAVWLSNLAPAQWARWAGAITRWPLRQDEDKSEAWLLVRDLACRKAGDAVVAALNEALSHANGDSSAFYALRRWTGLWSPAMEAMLLRAAERTDLSGRQLYEILMPLCARGSIAGQRLARAALRPHNRANQTDRAVAAAQALLHGPLEQHWPAIFRAMRTDPHFGKAVIEESTMEGATSGAGFTLPMRLKPGETADLFVWLARIYSYRQTPRGPGSAGSDFMAERLRDSALFSLQSRAAVEEIQRIRRRVRYPWLKNVEEEAASERLRSSWQPPTPADLRKLFSDSSRRLVRNGRELQELVLQSLQEIGQDIQGEHACAWLLWNTLQNKAATRKTEPQISTFIAHDLKIRLAGRGVAINREIEIKPAHNRTDIHATATTVEGHPPAVASVTIEAKGSWNPNLNSSMKEQLLQRYLNGTSCNDGIYLVYWDGTGGTLDELRTRFKSQASALSQGAKSIKAVVLDCSPPPTRQGNRKKQQSPPTINPAL